MTDPLKTYTVTLRQHELDAMNELVLYLPAIADSLHMPKVKNWSRMIEDVLERLQSRP